MGNLTLALGDGSSTTNLSNFDPFRIQFTAGEGDDTLTLNNVPIIDPVPGQSPVPISASAGAGDLNITLSGMIAGAVTVSAGGDLILDVIGGKLGPVALTAGKFGAALLDVSGETTVTGLVTVKGFSANLNVTGSLNVTGNVSVLGSGEAILTAAGAALTVGGNLTVTSEKSTQVSFATSALSEVKGNISVRGGSAADSFAANANFKATKNLALLLGGGANTVSLVGSGTGPTIGAKLSITTGAGADTISLDRVQVTGTTSILTGGGIDDLAIRSGSTFTGSTTIDLGAGADTLAVASLAGVNGPVTFTGKLTARMGTGNDTLILGTSGAGTDGNVAFGVAGNQIDGGGGLDLFDGEAGQFDATKVVRLSFDDPTP